MTISDKLFYYQEKFFTIFIIISYLLLFISFLGFSKKAPEFLNTIDTYVKIYVCLFLIIRFNPFTHIKHFTELDRKIAFTAGIFILTTTLLNTYLVSIESKVEDKIKNHLHSL